MSLYDEDGYMRAMIRIVNNTDADILLKKCIVDYFYMENPAIFDDTVTIPDFVFCNGLTFESTYEDVEAYLGMPYYHYEDHSEEGKEFLMITYEMLHTAQDKVKSTNLVFLPPLGIRYFDIHTLLPYAVETSNMLSYQVQTLWTLLLDMYKKNPASVALDVSERVLTIED